MKNRMHLEAPTWFSEEFYDRAERCRDFLHRYGFLVNHQNEEVMHRLTRSKAQYIESDLVFRERTEAIS